MSRRRRPRMSFREAMDFVPDDLPDGAYWAMAHEIADMEYGDGFLELAAEQGVELEGTYFCNDCHRSFKDDYALFQHNRDKHGGKP